MKRTKKIVSILLTLVMALAMSIPAFAEDNSASGGGPSETTYEMEGSLTNGSITIDNAVVGQTYSAYQILYLEKYDSEKNAYLYKANSKWENWLKNNEEAKQYVSFVSDKGQTEYVIWAKKDDNGIDTGMETFAKIAQAYATSSNSGISAVKEIKANRTTVTFSDLKLGYYLVDTSLGTLCSLNTTKPSVIINEKNTEPTIEKKVQEDSDKSWGDENTAQIGDTVEFKTTVHAKKGAQGYVVHDQMSEGLTLIKDVEADSENNISEIINIEVSVGDSTLTKGTDYNITYDVSCTDKDNKPAVCAFHITFEQAYLDKITGDTDIVIEYSAILNENAKISTDVNTNKTKLDYGSDAQGKPTDSTEWDETKTYTYKFQIVKTDAKNYLLDGAKFELYTAKTDGTKIPLVEVSTGNYRVATEAEKADQSFTSAEIVAKDGKAFVSGLDANTTYWLEETKAPDGYNKLAARVEVKILEANLEATFDLDETSETYNAWQSGGVHVTNYTGTELPSTGGIGTTVFYAVGVILALGAAVALVARRRMRTE